MGQGREGAAAAQEKLKPDEPEVDHEETKADTPESVDSNRNRVDSDIDSDVSVRQPAELVRQEGRYAQDSDRIRDTNGDSDLSGVESDDRVVNSGATDPPHVAHATESNHATCGATSNERHKWGPNVSAFPDRATCGTPHVADSNATGASRYTQSNLPEIKWFSFERRKVSKNTWAYCVRWHKLDRATGKYDRVPPIYVRRVSDATDAVLRRRDNTTLKKLVRQWYEEKTGQQFVSAS